ncbi:unnamed protein product [Phytomonas sp. EM1]|nr:unnamed protein product [Phytomonas sp. EM1]|eukprot:CCW62688.1 unnamed protein product [Phytomonas sp. isolate EM1]
MRLTIDLLRKAPQFNNTILQREIDLRGLSISSLDENVLLLLENRFDVINLTSNVLTCLEFFPQRGLQGENKPIMDRVVTLIAHRNQIRKVSIGSCVMALPNLCHFLADRNNLGTVRDLYFLRYWKKLEIVSLEANPVWDHNPENYSEEKIRSFMVFLCPHLKLINYSRVTQADRRASEENRKEFKALMTQWEREFNGVVRATTELEGGKKIRKRGREMRGAEVGGASSSANANAPSTTVGGGLADVEESVVPVTTSDSGMDREDAEYESLQRRLEELEAKILSENTTPAEISAMEQEFNEITMEVERCKKRRKH